MRCAPFSAPCSPLRAAAGEVLDGYPAEEAGVKEGDILIEVAGVKAAPWVIVSIFEFGKRSGIRGIRKIRKLIQPLERCWMGSRPRRLG